MTGGEILDTLREIAEIVASFSFLGGLYLFRQKLVGDQINALEDRFERLSARRQATIESPKALKVVAKERGLTERQYIINHEAQNGINEAYILFLRKTKWVALRQRQWRRDLLEIQEFFQRESVQTRWQEVCHKYELPFQEFVETQIIETTTENN